jgi:hypothetical protein
MVVCVSSINGMAFLLVARERNCGCYAFVVLFGLCGLRETG